MKGIYLLYFAVFICSKIFSQGYNYIWIFGDSTGLNFNSSEPEYVNSSIVQYEAGASISDLSGGLLFYTNGETVWNKNHIVMPNGDNLNIGGIQLINYGSTLTQGVIIIPKPESEYLYFIIQMQSSNLDDNYGLEYSIVDMNAEGGLGNVMEKNKELFDEATSEKMQAVKHANGRDWWLLVHYWKEIIPDESYDLVFTRFLITPDSIKGPWYQDYGPDYNYDTDHYTGTGEMVFSQDGSKLAYTRGYHMDVFDFDRCSGELSNHYPVKNISTGIGSLYGCAFSPDGSKVYVTDGHKKKLYQYCLNCEEIIDSTKQIVYDGPTGEYWAAQLELASDGKIYYSTPFYNVPNEIYNVKNQNLSVINNPNAIYPYCDFDTNTISLGDNRVIGGLPNMPNYNLGALAGSACDTITAIHDLEIKNEITLYPNPANSYIIITSQSGNYSNIKSEIYNASGIIVKEMKVFSPNQKINLEDLPSGIYHVAVKQNNEYLYHEKLMIIR